MEVQEIFDKVVTHLSVQGKPAETNDGYCMYRTPEGLSCAVGCLIPDEEYTPDLECGSVITLIRDKSHVPSIKAMEDHKDLLIRLQDIHDTWADAEILVEKLKSVAINYNLDTTVLNKLSFPDIKR